ncbi:MAG: hypothetical protein ACRDPS_17840 [Nocardioides sp.]|uniref:hypothetical protein n=1 Tax=Nocardioides sp. TaxID=35761 RepID=UPI003D6BF5E6
MPSPPSTINADLARALRVGPFSDALDAAIHARGLTLDRIRHHLEGQGITVSEATLSYWRRGRSRPEREASIRAIQALEPLLGVPTASLLSLLSLLGPRRPRGVRADSPDHELEINLTQPVHTWLREQFGPSDRSDYDLHSVHDVVTIRGDRSHRSTRSRFVLSAKRDGLGRVLVLHAADDPWGSPTELLDVRNCTPGQMRVNEQTGLVVVELLFDRFLMEGDHTVIEYEFGTPPGPVAEEYGRQFAANVGQFCLQIQFAGSERVRLSNYRRRTASAPEQAGDTTWMGSEHSPCRVGTDMRGAAGVRWHWMDS